MIEHFVAETITGDDSGNESLLINDVARLLRKDFDKRAQKLDLTRSQWLAIAMLRRNPGIKQTELSALLEVEPISVARIIDRLEKAGWVERRLHPSDRRVRCLFLTKQSEKIVSEMNKLAIETRKDALQGIDIKNHEILLQTIKQMKANLCGNRK